jgi:hypothetical protein
MNMFDLASTLFVMCSFATFVGYLRALCSLVAKQESSMLTETLAKWPVNNARRVGIAAAIVVDDSMMPVDQNTAMADEIVCI